MLILLTDGANNAGQLPPLKAAELAAQEGLKIYTIGIGAEAMEVRQLLLLPDRQPFSADLDEKTLKAIAETTGGRYFRARDSAELAQIYALLDQLEPVERGTRCLPPGHRALPLAAGGGPGRRAAAGPAANCCRACGGADERFPFSAARPGSWPCRRFSACSGCSGGGVCAAAAGRRSAIPSCLPHLLLGRSRRRAPTGRSGCSCAGLLLAVLALAGPTWQKQPQPLFRQQSALVILFDLSRSMNAGRPANRAAWSGRA